MEKSVEKQFVGCLGIREVRMGCGCPNSPVISGKTRKNSRVGPLNFS
jgi:hypothetical protein